MFELPEGGPEPLLKALIDGGAGHRDAGDRAARACTTPSSPSPAMRPPRRWGRRSRNDALPPLGLRHRPPRFRRDGAVEGLHLLPARPAVPAAARRRVRRHRRARREPDRAPGRRGRSRRRPSSTALSAAREQLGRGDRRRCAGRRWSITRPSAISPRSRSACSPARSRRSARCSAAGSTIRSSPARSPTIPRRSASCGCSSPTRASPRVGQRPTLPVTDVARLVGLAGQGPRAHRADRPDAAVLPDADALDAWCCRS